MTNAKQCKRVKKQILEHPSISIKFFRGIDIGALINLEKMEIEILVEHEVETVKLKERVFKNVAPYLKVGSTLKHDCL